MAKKIVLTGGGTAGHVTPNIALVPKLRELGYEIYYIGSYEGIEKKLGYGLYNTVFQFNINGCGTSAFCLIFHKSSTGPKCG